MGHKMREKYDVDEISFQKLIEIPLKYKYSIIFLMLLTTAIAFVYIYFHPNIYKASTTIEIGVKEPGSANIQDLLSSAIGKESTNIQTEIEIVKSRFVANMALKHVDFVHHYYGIKNYKKQELYKESPFLIDIKKGYGIKFYIYPINKQKFRLVVKQLPDGSSLDKEFRYNEAIKNRFFEITVKKVAPTTFKKYLFVASNPKKIADKLRKRLTVKPITPKAAIILIEFEDNVALRAKEYVNALAKAYLDQSIERKTKEATLKLQFIDKQLKEITKNLRSSEDKLSEFKKESNLISLSSKAQAVLQRVSQLETQLQQLLLQKKAVQLLYKQIQQGYGIENLSIVGLGANSQTLAYLLEQLQNAIIKKRMLLQDYTSAHPEVIKVTKSIIQLKRLIFKNIKSTLEILHQKEIYLRKEIAKANNIIESLPENEKILTNLKRKFLVNEKIYSYLLEKRNESSIIKASTISSNRVIDKAELPDKPIKPKKKLILILGAVIGFILGMILAFMRYLLSDKIESKDEVEKLSSIPLVGVIPHVNKHAENIIVSKEPKSAIAESFRSLRTNLQFMVKEEKKIIAITSTIAGEGKTFISVNLATIISMTGLKTIIINGDMRKPTLHEKFNLSNEKGLSTYLSGKSLLYEIIAQSNYENLDVITSGPIPPNPSELINSRVFKELIERLREVYDVIVLDTPPLGLVSDARVIMELSDVNLYIVRENYSKKSFLKNVDKLKEEQVRGLGIVYNDAKESKDGYYGYGYYN